jgi:RNA-directed DNA polymerase
VYTATEDDRLWLQSVQRKPYARSRENPDYQFEELWGLVTDPRNLRIALSRVQRNRGARTAGVDRVTVRKVLQRDADDFLAAVRQELRDGSFHPGPVRRVLIPKAGKPGAFRPLGIPTVTDRVVKRQRSRSWSRSSKRGSTLPPTAFDLVVLYGVHWRI